MQNPKALLAAALALAAIACVTHAAGLTNLALIGQDYPRTFFFRQAETAPAIQRPPYEKWQTDFSRLSGIIGKCLDEEVVGRETRNPEWFTRFKHDHPDQTVLLHFNGNARDPRHQTEKYFPGHWVYRQAVRILADIPAAEGETIIRVADADAFRVNGGRYKNANDDIALFGLTPDSHHDWNHCEQVQLLAVDTAASTIRVKRACYGTKPLAFRAGQARAAAHQTEGPWGKNNHLLWFYNFSTHCPKDAQGKTCADRLVDELAGWFNGGKLAAFDGLEFDVMFNQTDGDTDGDGVEDDGVIAGINNYGIGMVQFARQLRARLGPQRIIQGDGALGPGGVRSQRCFGILNGIESEGWPNLNDWDCEDWSGGLNRLAFWHANAFPPAFNYINHKWVEPVPGKPGEHADVNVPLARHRLAFAAAQFTDTVLCAASLPPSNGKNRAAIWDEFIGGKLNRTGWLGKPLAPAIHLATTTPDLLGNAAGDALAKIISGPVAARAAGDSVLITPAANADETSFSIRDVPVNGSNLLITVTMKADPRKNYPHEMARLAEIGVGSSAISLLKSKPDITGMAVRRAAETPINPASGARVTYHASEEIGGKALPAYFTHPPFQAGKGYTFWCADVDVPAGSELRFSLGMSERSPAKSDGVWFSVHAAPLTDNTPGKFTQIFAESSKAHAWLPRQVSLAQYAGQRVRLKFVSDCGPRDNSSCDQNFWGDVKIVHAGTRESELQPPQSRMTWANDKSFTSTFYFRNLTAKTLDLTFRVEGGEPVTLQRVAAYAAPDAMSRVFEHGLVLANPGLEPYTFDLEKIAPGRHYRRIQATPEQDTAANNGQPVGPKLTLGPREGLFLTQQP